MKLFETALKNFEFLGLEWDESSKKYIYTKNYLVFLFQIQFVLLIISCTLFLIYDAKTFYEYTFEFMLLSTAIMCPLIYIILNFEVNIFNNLIENFQNMVDKSK